jgi:hypothetical protein
MTSTVERALPSSAVQLRCWSRPTTTTRLPSVRLPAKLMLASVMVLPLPAAWPGGSVLPLEPGDGGHRGMPRGHQGQVVEPTNSARSGSGCRPRWHRLVTAGRTSRVSSARPSGSLPSFRPRSVRCWSRRPTSMTSATHPRSSRLAFMASTALGTFVLLGMSGWPGWSPITPAPGARPSRADHRLCRWRSRWSAGHLGVSEGGLEPPRPIRTLGPQPGQRCLPRPA